MLKIEPWHLYTGSGQPRDVPLPSPPSWRKFSGGPPVTWRFETDPHGERRLGIGEKYQASQPEVDMVNAALYLRRPLLVTGGPGTGKSSLAYAVARELQLGPVLRWNITSRSTLQDGLYAYDAIGRLQDASLNSGAPDIGRYLRLGALGTALLPSERPRVLLIDEIDKSDIDLPNDLLNIFEEGEFEILELFRLREEQREVQVLPQDGTDPVTIREGRVRCREFPFVVLTSNAEREFAPAFLRRCLRLHLTAPSREKLAEVVQAHLPLGHLTDAERVVAEAQRTALLEQFLSRRTSGDLATDQLMNAVFMIAGVTGASQQAEAKERLVEALLQPLTRREIDL